MGYFLVTTVHGPSWDPASRLRQQEGWDAHAAFMDSLVEEGFVLLGGPVRGGERALLVVEAPDEAAIRERLAEDPWAPMGIIEVGQVDPWSIWLDGIGVARPG